MADKVDLEVALEAAMVNLVDRAISGPLLTNHTVVNKQHLRIDAPSPFVP